MKKFLLISFGIILSVLVQAQTTTIFESFNAGTLPADWDLAQGIQVAAYNNPDNSCANDFGLQTPGVGGSNPSKILLPALTYTTTNPFINTGFKIYIFDANLKCNSVKPFPCTTYVKVYIVKSSFTTASTPTAADIYAQTDYQIVKPNQVNFVYVANPPIPNQGTFRVLYDFKTDLNCNQQNTKYVLDEFSVIQTGKGPLPVKFISFTAQQTNGKVALTWETAQEMNNKEFQVQRRNATGGFETIATIPSQALNGNSATALTYKFDDMDNLSGKGQMYYRIKQVDINGQTDYSETRSIRNNARNVNITVYPNPGRDLVKVTIPDGVGLVDVSVSDMSGKEVKRWNSTSAKNIELTNLRPGLYTIRVDVKESGDMLVNKLIIQ